MNRPFEDLIARARRALAPRYRIERELGRGGMALVLLGLDTKLGRAVAIKILSPGVALVVGSERFEREIDILASLSHPHILPLYDSGEADGLLFYVTPFIEGETLEARLARQGHLSLAQTRAIVAELADGLDHAHDRGIIHRDIKPGNILFSGHHAILADFGIAKLMHAEDAAPLTGIGLTIGTPAYMSPEQLEASGTMDRRSDVYALGCVTWQMLAGRPPFGGATPEVALARQMAGEVEPLAGCRPELTPAVDAVLARAMARLPEDRFDRAGEFAAALARDGRPSRDRTLRGSRRFGAAAAVVTMVLVAGLAGGVATGLFSPGDTYAVPDPRRSFIVLPHRGQTGPGPEGERLTGYAASELSRLLRGFEDIRAVASLEVPGILADLGLSPGLQGSLEQSFRIAREARVGTLVAVQASAEGGTLTLEAAVYDVAGRREIDVPRIVRGPVDDFHTAVAAVARQILGLAPSTPLPSAFDRESTNRDALRLKQIGLEQLMAGQLESAERSLRSALDADPDLALGHLYLAMTLYWQAARDVYQLRRLGPSIHRHAVHAAQREGSLGERGRDHIRGMLALAEGDFAAARQRYRHRVASDPYDALAWLQLGNVEFEDFWLDPADPTRMIPRGSFNRALDAFREAVSIVPGLGLGYGRILDVQRRLYEGTARVWCTGFEVPPGEPIRIWEDRDATRQRYLCPVVGDSIEWAPRDQLSGAMRERNARAAEVLRREALEGLERWRRFAPDDPAPLRESARWLLTLRDEAVRSPEERGPDTLALIALARLEEIAALEGDTSVATRHEMAAALMALGEPREAARLAASAMDRVEAMDGPTDPIWVPLASGNPFLAAGQIEPALRIAGQTWLPGTTAIPDPEGGPGLRYLVEPEIARVIVYGAVGLDGPELREAVARIMAAWDRAGYSRHQQVALRRAVGAWIAPALVLDVEILRRWTEGWSELPWQYAALLDAEAAPAEALARLDRAMSGPADADAENAYLTGVVAAKLGRHDIALERLGWLLAAPIEVSTLRAAWGLRSRAHLLRARSYLPIGDTSSARSEYARLLDLWEDADPRLGPAIAEAHAALAGR